LEKLTNSLLHGPTENLYSAKERATVILQSIYTAITVPLELIFKRSFTKAIVPIGVGALIGAVLLDSPPFAYILLIIHWLDGCFLMQKEVADNQFTCFKIF
jgi:hypothetical protein